MFDQEFFEKAIKDQKLYIQKVKAGDSIQKEDILKSAQDQLHYFMDKLTECLL